MVISVYERLQKLYSRYRFFFGGDKRNFQFANTNGKNRPYFKPIKYLDLLVLKCLALSTPVTNIEMDTEVT